MDYIVHGVAKRWTQRNNFHFHFNPEYSLEGLMLKHQYFGHLMPRIQPCQEHFLVLLLGGASRIPLTGGRSTRKKVKVKVSQSCPTLWDPMGNTVHGILQTRILE